MEGRGVWIHDSTCREIGGARLARECHQHGLNMLMPKVPWLSGPMADEDYWTTVMAPMVEEAHRLEMEVHAWVFFLSESSVDNEASLMQVMESGKVEYAACAANPETVKRNLEKIGPILNEYSLDGFNLEDCFVYHRWTKDPMICFCDHCKKNAPTVPADRLAWNRDRLTELLEAIVRESKILDPDLKISMAARVPYETHAMPMSADWKLWCEKGLLDFIAPMIYERENDKLRQTAIDAMKLISRTKIPVHLGLGAYMLDRELTGHDLPGQLGEQIAITRDLRADGHILYHLGGITRDQFILMERAYS